LITYEKYLDNPDNLEENFEDNINFKYCFSFLDGNAIFEISLIDRGKEDDLLIIFFKHLLESFLF